jgi:hypothetical protein
MTITTGDIKKKLRVASQPGGARIKLLRDGKDDGIEFSAPRIQR